MFMKDGTTKGGTHLQLIQDTGFTDLRGQAQAHAI